MNRALFNKEVPGFDFLGGPVEMVISLPADGAPLTLKLEARITTGYTWKVVPAEGVSFSQSGESDYAMVYAALGAPSIQTLTLVPSGTGTAVVKLVYNRSFEPDAAAHARLSVTIPDAVSQIEISNPAPVAPVRESPLDVLPLKDMPVKESLPAALDWRTSGIVTPVRDQGGCGSCWAFGTVGVMESAVLKGLGPSTDLSEQFLISCNKDVWGCNGGLTASMYHYDTLGFNQSVAGAVQEADKPYTLNKGTCTVAYSHPYKLDNWAFHIAGGDWGNPTTAQIKTAIATYGPVTAGVCVGPKFKAYTGGVMTVGDDVGVCNGFSNHQIGIVGWDDATSSWIMRNSWGPSWGESGYMRIKYGISLIGQGTSWATYTAPTVPITYSPDLDTYSQYPAYSWSRIHGAAYYTLAVYDKVLAKNIFRKTISNSYCSTITNRCSFTPGALLVLDRGYRWKVATSTGTVDGTFSPWRLFTVKAGLNNSFNNEFAGWSARQGGTWKYASSAYVMTDGVADAWSSIGSVNSYRNFTYEVKMKRYHATVDDTTNGLLVRGVTTPYTAANDWNSAYRFLFSPTGYFSVWKNTAGVESALQIWTTSSWILADDWNKLKVTMNNDQIQFYINNHLVWSGTDSSFTAGKVGVEMHQALEGVGLGNSLYVDWAKLGMSDFYKAAEMVETGQVVAQPNGNEPMVSEHTP
jgi:C1A family cysteine protease